VSFYEGSHWNKTVIIMLKGGNDSV